MGHDYEAINVRSLAVKIIFLLHSETITAHDMLCIRFYTINTNPNQVGVIIQLQWITFFGYRFRLKNRNSNVIFTSTILPIKAFMAFTLQQKQILEPNLYIIIIQWHVTNALRMNAFKYGRCCSILIPLWYDTVDAFRNRKVEPWFLIIFIIIMRKFMMRNRKFVLDSFHGIIYTQILHDHFICWWRRFFFFFEWKITMRNQW